MSDPDNPALSPADLRLESFSYSCAPSHVSHDGHCERSARAPGILALWVGGSQRICRRRRDFLYQLPCSPAQRGIARRPHREPSKPEKGGRIVFRFLVRYALVGAVAYAIFNSSFLAFRGFLWGLCLPVAAMMIEAALEAVVAFREH